MSEREELVNRMVSWLQNHGASDITTSLEDAEPPARGKYRQITFSTRRMDAAVNVWGSHRIDMHDSSILDGSWVNLHSEQEFYTHCERLFHWKG